MCYDDNARPPVPPGPQGAAHGQDLELASEDGTRFMGYVARADGPGRASAYVLIYPDVRGLHQFYKELAMRFAEQGIDALAIDYFGRTAGIGPRDESFEYRSHVERLEFPSVLADARAGLKCLRGDANEGRATFTLGFCMGGTLSLLTGTQDLGLGLAGV